MNTKRSSDRNSQHGFTLVEIAVALAIIGFLLGGAVMTLSAQMELRNRVETREVLERARDALIGFAIANGRFPCPALGSTPLSDTDFGSEQIVIVDHDCKNPGGLATYLPGRDLGVAPLNRQGFLLDAWGNPIRYAVTRWKPAGLPDFDKPVFRTSKSTAQLRAYVEAEGFPASATEFIDICEQLDASDPGKCATNKTTTNQAVAILFSTGKNGAADSGNSDNGNAFVSHTESPTFDDLVTWISPYTLYNRMIAAGAL